MTRMLPMYLHLMALYSFKSSYVATYTKLNIFRIHIISAMSFHIIYVLQQYCLQPILE